MVYLKEEKFFLFSGQNIPQTFSTMFQARLNSNFLKINNLVHANYRHELKRDIHINTSIKPYWNIMI